MLTWHVDYWDRLGWPDPFGSKAFSARQQRLVSARGGRMYTPQLVVGSRLVRGRDFWSALQKEQRVPEQIDIEGTVRLKQGKAALQVQFRQRDKQLKIGGTLRVLSVLYQKAAVTRCPRGENAGKTLKEFYVVRRVDKPQALTFESAGIRTVFELPRGEKPSNLGVVVLVEDTKQVRTLACRAFPIQTEDR